MPMEDTVVQVGPKPSPEIQKLIRKYRAGRIPPLIKEDGDPNEDGLLNGNFLTIYRTGIGHYTLSIFNLTPGGLLNRPGVDSSVKWDKKNANYIQDNMVRTSWHGFCRRFRDAVETDYCERCDREFAAIVAEDVIRNRDRENHNHEAIAYLCHAGLIDLAMPVVVEGQPIAVFFSGQCWPAPGNRWNAEFVQERGVFRLLRDDECGVNALEEAERRLEKTRQRVLELKGEILPHPTDTDVKPSDPSVSCTKEEYSPSKVLTPESLKEALDIFQQAADYLSKFAGQTASLEKTRISAWLRGEVGRTLTLLREVPLSRRDESSTGARIMETDNAWSHLEGCLDIVGDYFGCDCLILTRSIPSDRRLLFSIWTKDKKLQRLDSIHITREQERTLRNAMSGSANLEPSPKLLSIAASINYEWEEPRRILRNCGIREDTRGLCHSQLLFPGSSWAGISAWRRPHAGKALDEVLSPSDREALAEVLHDVIAVAGTLLSLEDKDSLLESQEMFLEGMAHDIRNPIQAILLAIQVMEEGDWQSDDLKRRARVVGTSVRRVHNISNRVWFDRLIQRGKAPFAETTRVKVYDSISSCCKLVEAFALSQGVGIHLAESLDQAITIKVNRESFEQVVHNLLDNAIKYSDRKTTVRVECADTYHGLEIKFINRGVHIPEEEKERIFDRYYRSKSAEARVRQGTGIGLAIVKAFAEYYGRISVHSEPLRDGGAQTTFTLLIKKDTWRDNSRF